ncbi:MAG: hypothetical protein ACRDX8_00550, partial [Acidimicrobiales bacterium]
RTAPACPAGARSRFAVDEVAQMTCQGLRLRDAGAARAAQQAASGWPWEIAGLGRSVELTSSATPRGSCLGGARRPKAKLSGRRSPGSGPW